MILDKMNLQFFASEPASKMNFYWYLDNNLVSTTKVLFAGTEPTTTVNGSTVTITGVEESGNTHNANYDYSVEIASASYTAVGLPTSGYNIYAISASSNTTNTTKKYVSLDKLKLYDEKIKQHLAEADAAVLSSAKSYAENQAGVVKSYVGDIPAGYSEETVIAYINKKAEETLTSATGGSSESAASVLAALNTYKAENDPKVQANTDAIAAINNTESGVLAQAKAYADSADDDIQDNVDELSAKVTTLIGSDANKSVRTIANEELAAQLIADNADASLDTLQEIAAWIQSHPDDAAAMNEAIEALEAKVNTGDQTVTAYVTAAINALSIGDYAKAAELTALAARVTTLEGTAHSHANKTVLDGITAEQVSAWDTAEASAKAYADDLVAGFVEVTADEVNALFTV